MAYIIPSLIDHTSAHNEVEQKLLCEFLSKHLIRDGKVCQKGQVEATDILDILELENLNAMLKSLSVN